MANLQLLPYAQQVAAIERQRKLANLLQEQGMQPSTTQMVSGIAVPTSPWESASKLAQNIASIYAQSKADEREAALEEGQRKEATDWFSQMRQKAGPQKGWESTPVMEQSSDEDRTEMAPKMVFNDITGEYEPERTWKETTKPGMSAEDQNIELMKAMQSGNKYVQNAANMYASLYKPKDLEFSPIDQSKYTPESVKAAMAAGNRNLLEPITETKAPSYQRTTKEWSDQSGNKWKQDYAFDPTTKKMEAIGDKYLADVYHAPGASKDDETKAGATLRSEYNSHPVVKNHSIITSSYQTMLNTPAADPNDNTGAGDMSLIFNYMKMLDPNSVVREGEYATAQNSGSIPQRVINAYNNAIRGTKLDAAQRANFLKQAKVIYDTSAENEESVYKGIMEISKNTGVNPRIYRVPTPRRRATGTEDLPPGFVVQQDQAQDQPYQGF
jgi:hypothetical protein